VVRFVLAAFSAALALMVFSSGASAVIVHLPGGHAISFLPLRSAVAKYDRAFSNLDYNGGLVMPSNTNYMVYWDPTTGPAYPADYKPGINQYFTDLAHDSGLATNVDSVSTQYGDHAGNFANYNSHFGGAIADTDPYPANGCTEGKICLSDAQIQAELVKYTAAHSLPRDLKHEYFVITPPTVVTCFVASGQTDACSGNATANQVYCAYHSNTTAVPTLIYAQQPYISNNIGCDDGNHPNGTTADGALEGGLTHEHNESITDPQPNSAWTDEGALSGEIGDKCSFFPGPALGIASNGALYNQVINGHKYWYQEEWSNKGDTCLQRFALAGTLPTAQFTSVPAGGTKLTLNGTGSTATGGVGFFVWQPNDFGPPSPQDFTFESHSPSTTYDFGSFGDPVGTKYNVGLTVMAPDGTSRGISQIVKTGDEGPVGSLAVTTAAPTHGVPVTFSAAASKDTDGSITAEAWNFGDGVTGTGATPSHTYAKAGTYPVTLTVTDSTGQTANVVKNLKVS
jgi:hypothetical protein